MLSGASASCVGPATITQSNASRSARVVAAWRRRRVWRCCRIDDTTCAEIVRSSGAGRIAAASSSSSDAAERAPQVDGSAM